MVIDKLNFLLNSNFGAYNKCEIIEIFGCKRCKADPFNIFTLVVFENTKQENIEELMTEKLQKFKAIKDISWGIKRRVIAIDAVKKLFEDLLSKNLFQIDKKMEVGSLKLLPEQYIQSEDSFIKPQLNYLLKNNFHCGSYLVEFFDEDKSCCKFLLDNPVVLNDFSEKASTILPIKIGNLSDRLGNIIFQLPINNLSIHHGSIKTNSQQGTPKYTGSKIEITTKNNFDIKNLLIRAFEDNDNSITRQRLIEVTDSITEIKLDDCFGTTIEIYDKRNGLLVHRKKSSFIKQMTSNIQLIEPQQRVFKVNGDIQKIKVSHHQNSTFGQTKLKEFIEWIQNRKYNQERKELENSKAFIQYYGNQETKALEDIRELINKHREDGVYLWDPYLGAEDIKNTMYYCEKAYVPLKAITGLKQHSSKEQAKNDMCDEFEQDSQELLFLNLEVRGKVGSNGYDFHDRFLIFPLEQPRVWSLGISVNQLGASHHILQEVKNAQHILNAFNQLWDALDKEECLVWKSK